MSIHVVTFLKNNALSRQKSNGHKYKYGAISFVRTDGCNNGAKTLKNN